jgi:predicted metal-dependent phosphotriesterase family hydrolase
MRIETVLGPITAQAFSPALPHEHILVDFIGADRVSPDRYDLVEVAAVMRPYLAALPPRGMRGFADCTPAFLGRDPRLLAQLSRETGVHILTNTGLYKEPYLPPYAFFETDDQLADRWVREWEEGIDGTGIRPGFIKIAVNPGPLVPVQQKIVRAAARTSLRTGLAIACHTVVGVAALEALDILRREGLDAARFIVVHLDSEEDFGYHREVAARGAWVEYDSVGWRPLSFHVDLVSRLLAEGYGDRLLLSHDAGWYHVGEPGGGQVKPFTVLTDQLTPALLERGVDILPIIAENPARAFAVASSGPEQAG